MNFSPISDWGRIMQLASRRKSWKPGSSILITNHRLAGNRLRTAILVAVDLTGHGYVDLLDLAYRGAGHPHFLALDQEGTVVEDGAHEVGVVIVPAHSEQHDRHRDERHREGYQQLPHGPGGTSAGSHSDGVTPAPAKGGSVKGLEPSGAGWVPAPGQGRRTLVAPS